MRRHAAVPHVARKVLSTPSNRTRRVPTDLPPEPARPELRNQPRAQEFPPFRSLRSEITDSQPTPVKRTRALPKDVIFNLLQEIKGVLDAVEVEDAEDGNNGSKIRDRTSKTRRGRDYYAKRGSNLSALEQLPLSPLMHPRLLEARSRFTKAKLLPSEDLNEFQRLININPYAQTLAKPVRVCILTGVRLPNSFFIPLTMKRDPRTGSLWQVPTGLDDVADQPMTSKGDGTIIRQEPTELSSRDNRAGRSVSSAKSHWRRLPRGEELEPPVDGFPAIENDGPTIIPDQQESTSADDKQHESTTNEASVRPASEPSSETAHPTPMAVTLHPSTPFQKIPTPSSGAPTVIHKLKSISVSVLERGPAPPPDLPKAYILSSNAALSHVSSLPRSQFLRLLPYRWKGHFGASLKTSVWREDMADLVLSLLRKRVVKWLLSRDGAISVPERRVSEMDLPGNLSALLWVVDPWEEPCGDGQVKGEGKLRSEPPLGAVVRMGGKPGGRHHEGSDERNRVDGDRIPVFNLPRLLGQESLGDLQHGRAQHNYKKWSGWLGLEQCKLSMKLVGMLWGLTRYVGDGQVELREWAVR